MTPDLSEWVGVYPFSEFFEPNQFFEYRIVIQDGGGAPLIVADGHLTCYRLHGIAKAAGANTVNIYYESNALGCTPESSFSKGDLLLSIERKPKGYVLHWKDYPWAQLLTDKKETYEFCLWTNVNDRRVVTLRILDFPDEWFSERVSAHGGLEPELPLDQLKSYASPDGPLALVLSGSK